MRQVRDINFFVGVSDQANTIRKDELLLSLPYDVIVSGVSGMTTTYECRDDNYHCYVLVLNRLNNSMATLLSIPTENLLNLNLGFDASMQSCTSSPFPMWQERMRWTNDSLELSTSVTDGYLPQVVCSSPLLVNTQDTGIPTCLNLPENRPARPASVGKRRHASGSRSPSSTGSSTRQPHPTHHPATSPLSREL